jgi:hypothetical protein
MRDDGVEMTEIFGLLITANIVATVILWTVLTKERKRTRVLCAFVAGLVRSVSDYVSGTDKTFLDEIPIRHTQLPLPYKSVLEAIEYELAKNVTMMDNYENWLLNMRRICRNENDLMVRDASDDGFVFMAFDLFDDLLARCRSPELMTTRQKEYLSQEVVVTKENIKELAGEIAMYKDLMAGKFTLETPEAANIDNRLALMFSHLKQTYRNNIKDKLLGDRSGKGPMS